MANKVSKIKLTEPQMLWLSAICSKLREGRQVSARALKVELRNRLPRDFDPAEIDPRLLRNEDKITPLGVGLLDPDSDLVEKTNRVIQSVSEFLQSSPNANIIGVDHISEKTKLSKEEVAHIFKELAHLGIFHDSGSNYGYGVDGWLSINIDKRAFDAYLKYESIKQILDTIIEDATPSAAAVTVDSQHNAMASGSNIDIFISHSSQDRDVANALINLLRAALNLPSHKIRCTSVPAYMFDAGTPIDEQIRIEVYGSTVLIGLITPDSAKSTYVLFELGARWGAGRQLSLLLASGADADNLPAPLAKHSALRCDDAAQVQQFVEGLASKYGFELDRASAYENHVRELVKKSKKVSKRGRQKRGTEAQSEQQNSHTKSTDEVTPPDVPQDRGPSSARLTSATDAASLLTQEIAAWLLKDFLNGTIIWLGAVNKRFSENEFVISASNIQTYSDIFIYRLYFFDREMWNNLLSSSAGEYFLNTFPAINDQLMSFGKKMDEFEESVSGLEKAVEASPALLRRLIDLYAKKMERERIPRWEFERLNLEEIAARWTGELGLSISNYPVESKNFIVRFTAYKLLGLKVEFPVHARRADEIILNFTGDLPEVLQADAAVVTSTEEAKLLYADIARESEALFGQLKSERLSISMRYKAPF